MKHIALSGGKRGFAIVDDEDFERVSQFKWQPDVHGKITYAKHIEYVKGGKGKVTICILMHRLILDLHGSRRPFVDHRNGDGLDNQRLNLRIATTSQNNQNMMRLKSGKTSRFKGVSLAKRGKPWRASICLNQKRMAIGAFNEEYDAALAYNFKAEELFGDFAHFNQG